MAKAHADVAIAQLAGSFDLFTAHPDIDREIPALAVGATIAQSHLSPNR